MFLVSDKGGDHPVFKKSWEETRALLLMDGTTVGRAAEARAEADPVLRGQCGWRKFGQGRWGGDFSVVDRGTNTQRLEMESHLERNPELTGEFAV